MKKYICILLIFILLLVFVGCSSLSEDAIIVPPLRISDSTIQASLANIYTFEEAFSEADAVARIRVGNWLAEDTDIQNTYFSADVLQCFKGNMSDTFTLIQDGCSSGTLARYPLFTNGNEILVFLKHGTGVDYNDPYWVMGSFTTFLDVSYDNNGVRYYADRYGIFGESINITSNRALENDISDEVYARIVTNDSIISEMQYSYPYIFSETDLLGLLGES